MSTIESLTITEKSEKKENDATKANADIYRSYWQEIVRQDSRASEEIPTS